MASTWMSRSSSTNDGFVVVGAAAAPMGAAGTVGCATASAIGGATGAARKASGAPASASGKANDAVRLGAAPEFGVYVNVVFLR
jgi:hypothetical protein